MASHDPQGTHEQLASIPNIRRISAYRSVPCIVGTDRGTVHAFLRGFDLEGHPIEPHLTEDPEKHPPFTRKDELEGIAPNVGRPFSSIEVGDVISITVPKVVVYRTASPSGLVPQLAVDWEGARSYRFVVSQKYAIQVGEETDAAAGRPARLPSIPIYWERPEVLPMDVFGILAELGR